LQLGRLNRARSARRTVALRLFSFVALLDWSGRRTLLGLDHNRELCGGTVMVLAGLNYRRHLIMTLLTDLVRSMFRWLD
jgi:hypothetical protein